MYDWSVDVTDYWESYLDPRVLSRTPGSILYVSFFGINTANVYLAESSEGNTLTVGEYSNNDNYCITNVSHTRQCYSSLVINIILESRPPFDLRASTVSPTAATITWSTPPPNRVTPWAIVYNYELVLSEYAFGLPILTVNSTIESFTFSELQEFNNYSVIIAAENQVGLSNFSIIFNFSTPQAGV